MRKSTIKARKLKRAMQEQTGFYFVEGEYQGRFFGRQFGTTYRVKEAVYERPFNPKRRPTKAGICAAARRCVKEGDFSNAVELVKLAYPESKIKLLIE